MYKVSRENNIEFVTVKNFQGLEVVFADFAASIYLIKFCDEIMTPQVKYSKDFTQSDVSFGKTIGRVAGRISNHKILVDGEEFFLSCNERNNTLHGGLDGFSHKFFKSEVCENEDFTEIKYSYTSPDGESGFPGKAEVLITYRVYNHKNTITISFDVITSKKCPFSLTTHTYFNLGDDSIKNLSLYVDADKYVSCNEETMVPETEENVFETINFKKQKNLNDFIDDESINRKSYCGYDHILLLNESQLNKEQIILENQKYRFLISTDLNAVVIYSDNFENQYEVNSTNLYRRRGIAIEPEMSPLSDIMIDKGNHYFHTIRYDFEKK